MSEKKPHTSWYYEQEVMDEVKKIMIDKKKWSKINAFITEAIMEKLDRERKK